jgi:hypothetical protein
MNIDLYVNAKKTKAIFEIGWFKNSEFSLFKLELFNKPDDINSIYIINIQIVKFLILFGFDWDVE